MIGDPQTVAAQTVQDAPTGGQTAGDNGWRTDSQGRKWIPARGRSGRIMRQGDETVEQAFARDAQGGKDEKPKRKAATASGRKPPAPTSKALKDIEHQLAEALSSPAMVFAISGEDWAVKHFTTQGPELARQLVAASEHSEWLRAQLTAIVAGEAAAVKLMAMAALTAAVVGYAAPPIIYFANLPVPDQARVMLRIPPRKPKTPAEGANAATQGTAQPAQPPDSPPAA